MIGPESEAEYQRNTTDIEDTVHQRSSDDVQVYWRQYGHDSYERVHDAHPWAGDFRRWVEDRVTMGLPYPPTNGEFLITTGASAYRYRVNVEPPPEPQPIVQVTRVI